MIAKPTRALVTVPLMCLGCVSLKNGDTPAGVGDASLLQTPEAGKAENSVDGGQTVDGGPTDVGVSDVGSDDVAAPPAAAHPPPPDAPAFPVTIASSNLRLHLTAAAGITCDAGRVTRWADQSSHHDDATLQRAQLGPQCQLAEAPHVVNGVDLPYFSAPVSAVVPNVIDETLDVDLSFLANSAYTIFVVERRWADYARIGTNRSAEIILGTTMPLSIEEMNYTQCSQTVPNNALHMGYVYYDTTPEFAF